MNNSSVSPIFTTYLGLRCVGSRLSEDEIPDTPFQASDSLYLRQDVRQKQRAETESSADSEEELVQKKGIWVYSVAAGTGGSMH